MLSSRSNFSGNLLGNVENKSNAILDPKTTKNYSEETEKQGEKTTPVSFEQQFSDLMLELIQDAQEEIFNCQVESNSLR